MSDRDPDSGQFTADADTTGLYGQQALEADNGYKPMPLANPVKGETDGLPDGFSFSEREGADVYSTSVDEESPVIPVEYFDVATGSPRDPKETISLEQAAHDLTAWHEMQEDSRAASISKDFADEIDAFRADPLAKVVEGDDVGNDAQPAEPKAVKADEPDWNTEWDGQGLDPVVAKAMERPQVKAALAEFSKAAEVQQQYSAGLETANAFARATFLQGFPELANLPIEHLQQGLVNLAHTNPQRFQAAAQTLQRVANVQQEQAAQQQRQKLVAEQNMERFSREQDQAFERLPGVEHGTEHRKAVAGEMLSYFQELGIGSDQLMHEFKNNPLLRSAAGQKVIYDAVKARLAHKGLESHRSKASRTVPTVQRPGIAGQARQADPHAALEAQFARTGSLKDAQKLYVARSNRK